MRARLFFVIGPAGSGKSTIAEVIARVAHAAYLDKDSLADEFTAALLRAAGTDPDGREDNEFYQEVVMGVEYSTLLRLVSDVLRAGVDVVVDAPFSRYLAHPDFLELAARDNAWPDDLDIVVVHVVVDEQLVEERLRARGLDRDAWKLAHWEEFWPSARATECRWRGARHVEIDNTGGPLDPVAIERAIRAAE